VLTQLFEITALFDMRLQPQLVLLQKTMMTVEGVARKIDPDHDIWAAADPVVRRWMLRELSPAARARRYAEEGLAAVRAIVRLADNAAAPAKVTVEDERHNQALWFALGAVAAGLAFLLAAALA
jgi:ubiquinone biosynthesis protein